MGNQENKCCGEFYKDKFMHKGCRVKCGSNSAIYGVGVIGAAVYFISHATTFWVGAVGLIKAFFWPALVVYEVLGIFYGK